MFNWEEIKRDSVGKIILLYRHQRVLDEGIITTGMRVLDVGGWGVLASRLLEEGADCVILDNFSDDQYFPERVKKLPHVDGDILDIYTLGSLGNFDVVTCFEMLEHCKDQPQAIKNMYTILNKGGTIVGTFPIPGRVHQPGEPGVNFLTEAELYIILKSAGFVNIEVEPTGSQSIDEEPCSLYFKAKKG